MRLLLVVLFTALLLPVEYKREALASSIEEHYKPITGELVSVSAPCDPGCHIKVDFGDYGVLSSPTSGVEVDDLYALEDKPKRTMTLYYNSKEGSFLIDSLSGLRIGMVGALKNHPIDISRDNCIATPEGGTTMGVYNCQMQALYAWDAELLRVYRELGGSKNPELKAAQLAWVKYRDAQYKWIETEFGNRQGSKWINGVMVREIELVRNQVGQLKSVYKGW